MPKRFGSRDSIADIDRPRIVRRSRNYRRRRCPRCGRYRAYRVRQAQRTLHDLGDPVTGRGRRIHVTYSQHRCRGCGAYFNADMNDLAPPKCHYTHRVMAMAVRLVVEDGFSYYNAWWRLWSEYGVFVPLATLQNWAEAKGKKRRRRRGVS